MPRKKGCALPMAERQARGPGEDCIACHMPRSNHEHRPHGGDRPSDPPRRARPGRCPRTRADAPGMPGEVVPQEYHWALMTKEERRDAARDLRRGPGNGGPSLAHGPRIDETRRDPGASLARGGRPRSSRRPVRRRITRVRPGGPGPSRERAPRLRTGPPHPTGSRVDPLLLGSRAEGPPPARSGARGVAKDDRGQPLALGLSPWRWPGSAPRPGTGPGPSRLAARRSGSTPSWSEARSLLVQCYLQSHEPDRADAELQVLLRFYPASREAWQRWYKQQKQAGPAGAGSPSSGEP